MKITAITALTLHSATHGTTSPTQLKHQTSTIYFTVRFSKRHYKGCLSTDKLHSTLCTAWLLWVGPILYLSTLFKVNIDERASSPVPSAFGGHPLELTLGYKWREMGRTTEGIAVPYLQLALLDIRLKKTETCCSCQCTDPVSMSCFPAFFFSLLNVANCKQ